MACGRPTGLGGGLSTRRALKAGREGQRSRRSQSQRLRNPLWSLLGLLAAKRKTQTQGSCSNSSDRIKRECIRDRTESKGHVGYDMELRIQTTTSGRAVEPEH